MSRGGTDAWMVPHLSFLTFRTELILLNFMLESPGNRLERKVEEQEVELVSPSPPVLCEQQDGPGCLQTRLHCLWISLLSNPPKITKSMV